MFICKHVQLQQKGVCTNVAAWSAKDPHLTLHSAGFSACTEDSLQHASIESLICQFRIVHHVSLVFNAFAMEFCEKKKRASVFSKSVFVGNTTRLAEGSICGLMLENLREICGRRLAFHMMTFCTHVSARSSNLAREKSARVTKCFKQEFQRRTARTFCISFAFLFMSVHFSGYLKKSLRTC